MNATRRKQINFIIDKIKELEPMISQIRDEEQDAFENVPESLQNSDRGEKMSEAIEALDEAEEHMSNTIELLTSAIE